MTTPGGRPASRRPRDPDEAPTPDPEPSNVRPPRKPTKGEAEDSAREMERGPPLDEGA